VYIALSAFLDGGMVTQKYKFDTSGLPDALPANLPDEIIDLDAPITTKINKIFSTTARIAAQNENITRAMLIKNFSSFSNKEYNGVFFEDFRSVLSLVLEKGQAEGHIRRDVSAKKLANILEGVFTLFVIDCLIKKSYSMSSKDLFNRLNICLEGMIHTASGKS